MKYIRKLVCSCCLLLGSFGWANPILNQVPDSLKDKSYQYLFSRVQQSENTKIKELYLRVFLLKAKAEHNWKQQVNAYKTYAHHESDSLKWIYADSMVYIARVSKDSTLIGSALISKGAWFYQAKDYVHALALWTQADHLITGQSNPYQRYKLNYLIALVKYYLDYTAEALTLLQSCKDYFKEDHTRAYLNTLHLLGLCYNKMGDYGRSSAINSLGLKVAAEAGEHEMDAYFLLSEGINQYFLHNNGEAIAHLKNALQVIKRSQNFSSVAVADFYLGKSFWEMRQLPRAMVYFKKVDSIFKVKGFLRLDLLENYKLQFQYYKSKGALKNQLYVIEQLTKAETVLHDNYKTVSKELHRQYEYQQILDQKRKVQSLLLLVHYKNIWVSVLVILVLVAITLVTYNRYQYGKKFDKLINRLEGNISEPTSRQDQSDHKKLGISDEAVQTILVQLEKFEKNKGFLDEDLKAYKLASMLQTNATYLSSVINRYKKKSVVAYINDLRIDYTVEVLHSNRMFRKYSNEALAKEAGFSSTPRFVNAFKRRTGISPTFFIRGLEEKQRK
ncbi:helix-turn-helix domain-containing protein [Zhouia sp. PK063]|uniref:helix-turn-helix domain-containing protein n=1 Tax=Zhouia sp. PK063 TaxID=3373602 RepID=UPI0037A4F9E3